MASISLLHSLSRRLCNCYFTPSPHKRTPYVLKPSPIPKSFASSVSLGKGRCRKQHLLRCKNQIEEEQEQEPSYFCLEELSGNGGKRREALFKMAFTAFAFPTIVSSSMAETDVAENFRVYTDDGNKFQISVPQGWQVGTGDSTGFKSVTAFYPEGASSSSVSVVITGLGPDFTRLESFGKVEAFAETLVDWTEAGRGHLVWQQNWLIVKLPMGFITLSIHCKIQAKVVSICCQHSGWHSMVGTTDYIL